MTHQNNLRERTNSTIAQGLDELVNNKRVGLNSDLVGRWTAALADPDSIDVESSVSCIRHRSHVRIELWEHGKVPVDVAVGCPVEQQVDNFLTVRFETKLADHLIVSRLPLL